MSCSKIFISDHVAKWQGHSPPAMEVQLIKRLKHAEAPKYFANPQKLAKSQARDAEVKSPHFPFRPLPLLGPEKRTWPGPRMVSSSATGTVLGLTWKSLAVLS